jgi:hypothetical protein
MVLPHIWSVTAILCPGSLVLVFYVFVVASALASLKRSPAQPRLGGHVSVKGNAVNTLRASAFSGYKVL